MDNISQQPIQKKGIFSDIQKYSKLLNNESIKAYFNKYIKAKIQAPQANSKEPICIQKPKKPQSFDQNCQNENPLKHLLHRASQVHDNNQQFLINDQKDHISIQYSFRTRQGQVINNPGKVNQDAFMALPNFLNDNDQHLFAVCDGHGTYGHYVSSFIKKQLPLYLSQELQQTSDLNAALTKSFLTCSNELQSSQINTTLSGSTVTLCLLSHNKIFTANCGDSRAIIGSKTKELYQLQSGYEVVELSQDHKPELPKELARILRMGGRVEPIVDWEGGGGYLGPNRVWLQGQNFPGLAMSRSFGDSIASSVGVSSVPGFDSVNFYYYNRNN